MTERQLSGRYGMGGAPARIRAVLDLAIRLAEVVFAAGAGAEDATAAMAAVTRAYGLRGVEPDLTHTVLTLSWTNPSTQESVSRSRIVKYRNLDYTKLARTSALIERIADTAMPVEEARSRLKAIVRAKPLVPWFWRRVGWSLLGAGAAVLLGGDAFVASVAFVTTFIVDLLTNQLARRNVPVFYQSCVGGALGPLAAAAVHLINPHASASLVVVATIIMLLAGVTTFGAVHDTLSGFYVTGTARLMEAVVITSGLAAGVSGMALLLDKLGTPLKIGPDVGSAGPGYLVPVLASIVIVAGFGLAVQLPFRAYPVVCALGALGDFGYQVAANSAFGPIWASGAAALVVGALAALSTGLVRTPALAIVVAALVPLVPGLSLFNGLMQLLTRSVDGLLGMLTAAGVAGALAAGAILGQYLVQLAWGPMRTIPNRFRMPTMALPIRFSRKER